jgi:hypothetical protein
MLNGTPGNWLLVAGAAAVTIGLAACAGAPQLPAASDTPVTSAAAAPAEAAANPYPGTTMREGPGGQTVYCWREILTGERIPKERCYTPLAMEQLKSSKREQLEKIRENSGYGTDGGP